MQRFLVINDFTALALSLPVLGQDQLRKVGPGEVVANSPLGLLGAGTGLGVSGLLPASGGRNAIPLNGEGGHVTLPAANQLETEVIDLLRARFGHASAERALSGPGLSNLYDALVQINGETLPTLDTAEISSRAATDARCEQVIEIFFSLLGSIAGNLALTLGARGGMYIGGGIVPRLGDWIDRSQFRERFEAKGRFRGYLSQIPTFVLEGKTSPALLGAARALEDL
jgi:glucokinase